MAMYFLYKNNEVGNTILNKRLEQIFVASMVANPCTIDNIQKHFNNSIKTNKKTNMGETMNK